MSKHPFYKLGKAPAQTDVRTLDWGSLIKAKVAVPDEYDFDVAHQPVPMPMFANDRLGCCVIAGRAHQTLRFELLEQKKIITISDKEIQTEYFKETGGPDSGLVVLSSLKAWQRGWKAAGKVYSIKAYAGIKVVQQGASASTSHAQIKEAIYLDCGVGIGVSLPISAQSQINKGQPWDVVRGRTGRAGSWGGHYVFVVGYNKLGPVCVTWGQKQQMTWAFWDAYCDECYAIFDALDTSKIKRAIAVKRIELSLLDMDAKPVKKAKVEARKRKHPRKKRPRRS